MANAPTTIVDLARLSLVHGEGRRLSVAVPLGPLSLGGQTYVPTPAAVDARLDISRPSGGYAFRLRFAVRLEGPCMRCMGTASLDIDVDVREVNQLDTDDEELRSPYVADDQLDVGRWAQDAAVLAAPVQILCRADCAGLCPVCGESLNDADPAAHKHDTGSDPRWNKLKELKLD